MVTLCAVAVPSTHTNFLPARRLDERGKFICCSVYFTSFLIRKKHPTAHETAYYSYMRYSTEIKRCGSIKKVDGEAVGASPNFLD